MGSALQGWLRSVSRHFVLRQREVRGDSLSRTEGEVVMTWTGFLVWAVFFAVLGFVALLVEGLCLSAGRAMPSPYDRIADYSAEGTACHNCPDLDKCDEGDCPHDWMDWGLD